ncbi:MAG TPA: P-loop NTPase fold protein [Acidimicrobiales bacterium]|nr:P-loop NTPase fold protein [Acidimicrobiales bacterium]
MVLVGVAVNIPWLEGASLLVALLVTPFSVALTRRPAARRLREHQRRVEEVQQRLRSIGTGSIDDFDALIEATVLAPAETRALTVLWSAADDEIVVMEDGPLLSSKAETGNILETAASRRLAVALQRRLGSAVGIAGSRGSGKTELVRHFTGPAAKSEPAPDSTVGVFLWAPVSYAPNMFLIRLLKEVCLAVLRGSDADTAGSRVGDRRLRYRHLLLTVAPGLLLTAAGIGLILGNRWNIDLREDTFALGIVLIVAGGVLLLLLYVLPGMAFPLDLRYGRMRWDDAPAITHARALLQRAEFVETNSMGLEVGASIQPFSAKGTSGQQLQRVPLTDLDVVWELQGLVQELAFQNRRTVIAIDELDKMRNDEEAIGFINHLKVLFPIRNCSFIVSVSESAWARFEHRGLPFRDAFDSALDEVIYLDLLTIAESRDLLRRRTGHITPLQALLCHCLAGGLPRDLLRAARHLAQAAGRADDRKWSTVLGLVLDEELEAKVKAAELRIRSHDPHNLHSDVLHELTSWRHRWRDPLTPESPRRHRSNETDVVIGGGTLVEGGAERTNSFAVSPQLPVDGESAMHVGNRHPEGATTSAAAEVKAVHAEVVSYVAFLLTVRDAFALGGPADGLVEGSAGSPLLQGFDILARARHRLSLDTVDACRMVARARVLLSLPKLDDEDMGTAQRR